MKRLSVLSLLVVSAAAMADPFSVSGAGGAIPDNNATGLNTSGSFSGSPGSITGLTSVSVTVSVAHTWVGDLRAFVTYGGQRFTLFQHVGLTASAFGYSTDWLTGTHVFDVVSAQTLDQAAASGNVAAGTRRAAHQASELSTTPGPNTTLSSGSVFNGMDPNGSWTLTIIDRAGGDIGSISGWSLEGTYNAVPEPATMAVLGLGVAALLRRRRK